MLTLADLTPRDATTIERPGTIIAIGPVGLVRNLYGNRSSVTQAAATFRTALLPVQLVLHRFAAVLQVIGRASIATMMG